MSNKNRRLCVVVAGMHRSGTSALSKVLSLLGCDLPKNLLGANPTNETGHWESSELMFLNDKILNSAGSVWDDWTPCVKDWMQSPKMDEFTELAQTTFLEEFGSSRIMVYKDPRLCKLMPFWVNVLNRLDIQLLVMMPFRNPLDVASSLAKRDGSDEQYNLLLWLRHVLDAEHGSRGLPRYLCSYNDLLSNWSEILTLAAAKFHIKWPRTSTSALDEIDNYLSPKYTHHLSADSRVLSNTSISPWVRSTYEILLNWKNSGERTEDYAILDRIRNELDASAQTFARLIYHGKVIREERAALQHSEVEKIQQISDLTNSLILTEERLSSVLCEVDQASAAMSDNVTHTAALEHQLRELEVRLNLTLEELEQEKAAGDQKGEIIATLQQKCATLDANMHAILNELEQQKVDIVQKTDVISTLEQQCATLDANMHAIMNELEQEKEAVALRSEDIAILNQQLAEVETRLLTTLAELEDQRNLSIEQADQLTTLTSSYVEIEGRLGETSELLAKQKGSNILLAEAEALKASELATVLKMLAARDALLSEARDEVEVRKHFITQQEGVISALHARVDQLNAEIVSIGVESEGSQTEIANLKQELIETNSALRQRSAETEDLHREIRRTSQALNLLQAENGCISKDILALKHSNAALQESAASGHSEAANLNLLNQALIADSRESVSQLLRLLSAYGSRRVPLLWRFTSERRVKNLRAAGLLDEEWYAQRYPDVASSGMAPAEHYAIFGVAEGRSPSLKVDKHRL